MLFVIFIFLDQLFHRNTLASNKSVWNESVLPDLLWKSTEERVEELTSDECHILKHETLVEVPERRVLKKYSDIITNILILKLTFF